MRNSSEMPQAATAEQAEEIELTSEMQELYDDCVAGMDREELQRKAREIGPKGAGEVFKKGMEFVGRNIRAFGLIGFTAVTAWAGGSGSNKPAIWSSEADYNHVWAIVATDKSTNIPEEVTINDLVKRGYSAEQIRSVIPGAKLATHADKADSSSQAGSGFAEVQ